MPDTVPRWDAGSNGMSKSFDLIVVGAGPGGLAAAAAAAEAGMRVCLVDDNPSPGGQIWRRSIIQRAPVAAAAAWLGRLEKANVTMRLGSRVVAAPAAK